MCLVTLWSVVLSNYPCSISASNLFTLQIAILLLLSPTLNSKQQSSCWTLSRWSSPSRSRLQSRRSPSRSPRSSPSRSPRVRRARCWRGWWRSTWCSSSTSSGSWSRPPSPRPSPRWPVSWGGRWRWRLIKLTHQQTSQHCCILFPLIQTPNTKFIIYECLSNCNWHLLLLAPALREIVFLSSITFLFAGWDHKNYPADDFHCPFCSQLHRILVSNFGVFPLICAPLNVCKLTKRTE